MTDASSTPPTPGSATTDAHLERLAQLHRMSRTAGLGSTEYAAINVSAVMAAVLGAASALTLVASIFLIVPVIGLVIAILAIMQIRKSNGTQTGMPLAVIGLVLCLAFSAAKGYSAYNDYQRREADKATLMAMISSFGDHLAQGDYKAAYAMLDGRYKDRVSEKVFETFLTQTLGPSLGKVTKIESNGYFSFDVDPEDANIRYARGMALISMERLPQDRPLRPDVTYRYVNGDWKIFNIPDWFIEPGQQPGAGGGMAPR